MYAARAFRAYTRARFFRKMRLECCGPHGGLDREVYSEIVQRLTNPIWILRHRESPGGGDAHMSIDRASRVFALMQIFTNTHDT